jgi:uracil-DNA glycosylase
VKRRLCDQRGQALQVRAADQTAATQETERTREIAACLPWLDKEIELIKPQVLVCLGATAAQALLGKEFRVSVQRGRTVETNLALHAVATVHPSSISRQPTTEQRHSEMERFAADLKVVAGLLNGKG